MNLDPRENVAADTIDRESLTSYEKMPEQHIHYGHRSAWLRALVLGANDGLVSISALMLGVGGGSDAFALMRLAGVAGWIAGALSMACGEYISVSLQMDCEKADIDKERQEQLKGPEAQQQELDELTLIYVKRGVSHDLARQLTEKDVIRAHARDELGIDMDHMPDPLQASMVSALAFSLGAAIPLLSGCFLEDANTRMIIVTAMSAVGLSIFGFVGAALGGAKVLVGTLRVLIGGLLAMGITYGVGRALNVNTS